MTSSIRRPFTAAIACVFALAVVAPALRAADDDAKPAAPKTEVDEQSQKVLKALAERIQKAKTFSVNSAFRVSQSVGGQKRDTAVDTNVSVARPNRLSIRPIGQSPAPSIVSDGKKLYVHIAELNRYTEQDAGESLEKLAEHNVIKMFGGQVGILPLLFEDVYGHLLEDVQKITYVGTEKVGEIVCHKLRFDQEQADVDVFITTGDAPSLVRLVPDMAPVSAQYSQQTGREVKIEVSMSFSDWSMDQPIADAKFAFAAPEGSEKVDDLFAREEPGKKLLGKAAPAFKLEKLGGGEQELASHQGKDIVILDFWATWCGPCVRAFPHLIEVANTYKDKNVVFYAVNLREDEDTINEFLAQRKFDLNVLLDRNGAIANKYGVTGIPQTVIIDKDGTIQVIHVGFNPNIKQQMSGELDSLLAGKKIAK